MKFKAVLACVVFVLWASLALAAPSGPSGPSGKSPEAGRKHPAPAGRKTVIKDVQVYSGRDYSRIVLVLSGQAQRHWQLLPQDPADKGVRRLYVDLDDVVIKPGVPSRFDVRGDVARKVRLSYFKPGVARLVVEVENLKSQQVFELENPNRVIVDVLGEASSKAQASQATQAPKPEAGPARAGTNKTAASEPAGEPAGQATAGKRAGRGKGAAPTGEDRPGSPGVDLSSPGRKKMAGQLVEQLGLTVHTVMVDPGHGGKDPGATGVGGVHEKNITLRMARLLGARLSKMGFEVLYTRTTDTYVPLEERTAMANARHADLFISIHCNSHSNPATSGLETYSLNLASTPEEVRVAARENSQAPQHISDMQKILDDLMHASKLTESREFAKCAQQATLSQGKKCQDLHDRGLHEAPFYVLLGARMPAILMELGYITNPHEAARLQDPRYQEALATGIAQGILAYKQRIEHYAAGK